MCHQSKLVFSLQLTVAQCSTLRYKGMKCKNGTAHAPIAMKRSSILLLILLLLRTALASVSRFDTRTLRTQRQQQYVRENGCARSVVCLLFVVVL